MNLRLIFEHTQTDSNAKDLQEKLLKLSHKINEKFTKPSANKLAFEIIGIAKGIFSKEEDKNDFKSKLPSELRQKIYAELIATRSHIEDKFISGLEAVRLVSKMESKIANDTKIAWINEENIFLKSYGCKTIQDAAHYIKSNHNLYSANLSEFYDLTDDDLKELQHCSWIQHFFISSDKMTGN